MGVLSRERLVLRRAWPDEVFRENTRGNERVKLVFQILRFDLHGFKRYFSV